MLRKKPIERVRQLCLTLPEASERLSHGEPTWFVGKKVFASWEDHHHGDPMVGLWLAAAPGLQEILVGAEPERFYRPKYVGVRGWIGVRMDVAQDWDTIADLIRDSYRLVAPRRLGALVV